MGVIKVKRIDVRRVVSDACHDFITDKDIAEKVYMKVMDNLEDYLSDCEDEELYDWRDEQEYEDRWERRTETIDLVRCEECKYGTKLATTNKITCKLDRQFWEKTDFCSYGERRADE